MDITVIKRKGTQDSDYREGYQIAVDGVTQASFYDGEPEDANLSRDFNDVYNIPVLMQMAYEAGILREGLDIQVEEV